MKRGIRGILRAVVLMSAVVTAIQPAGRSVFAQETSPQPVDSLESAHEALSKPDGNHHDAGLYLTTHGEAGSVPYLINALQWQEETKPGAHGMVCTKAHILEALRGIVNQNAGKNYPEWKAWWEKNKEKSREDWIHDGFRIANLPVTLPPDHDYCVALIGTANGAVGYLKKNALRVLAEVPDDLLGSAIGECMESVEKSDRLAAAHCLGELHPKGAEARLRSMREDSEEDVRRAALTRLNDILRATAVVSATDQARWQGKLGERVTTVAPGRNAAHLIMGIEKHKHMGRRSILASFDTAKREIEWEYPCSGVVNCVPVFREGRVYFTTDDGMVTCVESDSGKFVWINQTEGHPQRRPTNKLVFLGDQVVVTMEKSVWSFKLKDGNVLWKVDVSPVIGKLVSGPDGAYTLTEDQKLVFVSPGGEVVRELGLGERSLGLCANDQTVYVLSGQKPAHVTAYSIPSLSVVWQTEIGEVWNWGQADPTQVDERILACADDRIVALDRSNGQILWSVDDRADETMYPAGDRFVIRGFRNRLEVRSWMSGEVVAAYSEPPTYGQPMYVSEDTIATGDMEGNLWVLAVP